MTKDLFSPGGPHRALNAIYNSAANARDSLRNLTARDFRKAAANYLWPFRVGQALKAQKLVVPVLIAQQLIQMATTPLFPDAQEYLKEKGIDPRTAHELSDRTIRVRQRNLIGTLHSYNDFPTLVGMLFDRKVLREPAQAYARPPAIGTYLTGQCPVTLSDSNLTARHALAMLGDLGDTDADALENIPVTDAQVRTAIAFHEFRHCDSHNLTLAYNNHEIADREDFVRATANHAESDADAHGFSAAARVLHNKDLAKTLMYARALNQDSGGHDTALYVDAVLRNEKPPRELDAMQATDDVFSQLDIYQRIGRDKEAGRKLDKAPHAPVQSDVTTDALALEKLLKDHPDMFSSLAKRRADLFIAAVQYFFPKKLAQARADAEMQGLRPKMLLSLKPVS